MGMTTTCLCSSRYRNRSERTVNLLLCMRHSVGVRRRSWHSFFVAAQIPMVLEVQAWGSLQLRQFPRQTVHRSAILALHFGFGWLERSSLHHVTQRGIFLISATVCSPPLRRGFRALVERVRTKIRTSLWQRIIAWSVDGASCSSVQIHISAMPLVAQPSMLLRPKARHASPPFSDTTMK